MLVRKISLDIWVLSLIFCISLPIQAAEIRVLLVGDTMLDWRMLPYLKKHGFSYPFENVRPFLQRADIVAGNLEMPIGTTGERAPEKPFAFLGHPRTARAMAEAGFSVVTLANNHMMDYGPVAFADTLKHLEAAGIAYCGAGNNLALARKPAIIEAKGQRFAFLGYSNTKPFSFHADEETPGTVRGLAKYFQPDIAETSEYADVVIATFHWGAEYTDAPRDYQIDFAHRAIRSGAKVVFGHHPHILQGIEVYQGGIIAYSLGNFTFGSYNENARHSVMMEVVFDGSIPVRVEFIPINVLNTEVKFQPQVLTGDAGKRVIEKLNELSAPFGTRLEWNGERGVLHLFS